MQLKMSEPVDNNENKELEGGQNPNQVNDGMSNNNGYYGQEKEFDPEKEFDFNPEELFDTPKTFDNYASAGQGAANAAAGPGAYGTAGGAGSYGAAGAGTYAGNNQAGNVPNAAPQDDVRPRKLTKQEFFNSPRNRKDRDMIIISSIVVIVAAIVDIIRTDFWLSAMKKQIEFVNEMAEAFGMEEEIIDTSKIMTATVITSVILILCGLGIWILKSRACALTGLAFTIVNTLYTIVVAHNFRWYWTIIALGYAVIATFSFNKSWEDYEANGDWKREW